MGTPTRTADENAREARARKGAQNRRAACAQIVTSLPWWYACVGLVLGHLLFLAIGVVLFRLVGLPIGEPWAEVLFMGSLASAAIWLARRRPPLRFRDFGLRPTAARAAVGWVAALLLVDGVFTAFWRAAVHSTYSNAPTPLDAAHPGGAIGLAIAVVILAPVGEEFFFRGFVYRALRSRLRVAIAAPLAGAAFGVVHAFPGGDNWVVVPPLAVTGVLLCLLYERTGSLLPGIAAHMIVNSPTVWLVTHDLAPVGICIAASASLFLIAPWRFGHRPPRVSVGKPRRPRGISGLLFAFDDHERTT